MKATAPPFTRTAPEWLSTGVVRHILRSGAVRDAVEEMADDAAAPAGVRRRLREGLADPERFDDAVWPLCDRDTGVWPRLALALARASGVDPLEATSEPATDEQRFWTGVVFDRPETDVAAFASAFLEGAENATADAAEGTDAEASEGATTDGVVETSTEGADEATAEGPEEATTEGVGQAGRAMITVGPLDEVLDEQTHHATALNAERDSLLRRLDEVDRSLTQARDDAVRVLSAWLGAQGAALDEALRALAAEVGEDTDDEELRRLRREFEELLETREAALAHTHSSLRENLRASYDGRAASLQTEIDERVTALQNRPHPDIPLTVAAIWRDRDRLVVAPVAALEGLITEAAKSALRALDASDVETIQPPHGSAIVTAVVAGPDGAPTTAEAIAARMTEALRGVDEWPLSFTATVAVVGDPAALRGIAERADDGGPR